jgi:hypothetical protein
MLVTSRNRAQRKIFGKIADVNAVCPTGFLSKAAGAVMNSTAAGDAAFWSGMGTADG